MNIVDRIISPNIWDEVWENGYINSSGNQPSSSNIRSKNYIQVTPSSILYFKISKSGSIFNVICYGENKNYLSTKYPTSNTTLTLANNVYYIRFFCEGTYGNTYKHDICINVSNPSINGKYFPYVMYKRYDIVDLIHTHNLWNKTVKYNQKISNPNGTIIGGSSLTAKSANIIAGDKYLLIHLVSRQGSASDYQTFLRFNNVTIEYNYDRNPYSIRTFSSSSNLYLGYQTYGSFQGQVNYEWYVINLTEWFKNDIPQTLLDDPSTFNQYWDGELSYDVETDVLPNNSIKRLKIGG